MTGCSLHKAHSPTPLYVEFHHVVPQAWQQFWQPPLPWAYPGMSTTRPGLHLWDDRTVPICRTGHGNVHFWIVKMTHAWTVGAQVGDVAHKVRNEMRARNVHATVKEFVCATEALSRFVLAGGDVSELAAHKLWGEI